MPYINTFRNYYYYYYLYYIEITYIFLNLLQGKVLSQNQIAGIPTEEDKTPEQQEPPDLSNLGFEILPVKKKKRFLDGIIDKLTSIFLFYSCTQ